MTGTNECVLAVDFGGTRIRAAIVNRDGSIFGEHYGVTGEGQIADVVGRISAVIARARQEALAAGRRPSMIGIAAPGPIDFERGVILTAVNIVGFCDVPLARLMSERFGVPVFLQNDANAAALAEHEFGAGQGFNHMVYLTVSSGIGAGIIANGQLLQGATGNAGEVGQMTVDLNDRVYLSGCRGTMEGQASGDYMARYAENRIDAGQASSLREYYQINGELDGRAIAEAARQGDPLAKATWRRALAGLGAGAVSFIHVLNPQIVVVGGGVSNAGDMLLEPMRQYVARWAMPGFAEHLTIVRSTLGDSVCLKGAAVWAWRSYAGQPVLGIDS